MTSPSEKLDKLQDLLIDEFTQRIISGEATPSDLNAARQMLKDNGVQVGIKDGNPAENLLKMLPFDDVVDSTAPNRAQI